MYIYIYITLVYYIRVCYISIHGRELIHIQKLPPCGLYKATSYWRGSINSTGSGVYIPIIVIMMLFMVMHITMIRVIILRLIVIIAISCSQMFMIIRRQEGKA